MVELGPELRSPDFQSNAVSTKAKVVLGRQKSLDDLISVTIPFPQLLLWFL